jgi:hypothetical protein
MKVSVYLKKSSSSTSSICFRVREKNVDIKVVSPLTESDSIKLVKSHLYIADIEGAESIKNVNENDCGVSYESCFYEGKYDMQAFFTDDKGINYPAYYIYIEKL